MVLILSGAGGGCGHAPSPRQDPHPSPAELPALPSRPRPGARPLPALCARQTCCSCPRCWRSWLTVRDPGVRRQDWAGAGSRGWEERTIPALSSAHLATQPRHRAPPAALPPAPAEPGGARAPRAGSCRCSRHSHPAETSPLIISPDLMGFFSGNSSRHPLPTYTHAFTRSLPLHTPGVWERWGACRGAEHRAVSRDGPVGGPGSRLRCRPPNFVRLCHPFRGLSLRRDGAGWRPDPDLGLRSPLSALALPRGSRDLEYNSREKLGGSGDPYQAPHSALGCNS